MDWAIAELQSEAPDRKSLLARLPLFVPIFCSCSWTFLMENVCSIIPRHHEQTISPHLSSSSTLYFSLRVHKLTYLLMFSSNHICSLGYLFMWNYTQNIYLQSMLCPVDLHFHTCIVNKNKRNVNSPKTKTIYLSIFLGSRSLQIHNLPTAWKNGCQQSSNDRVINSWIVSRRWVIDRYFLLWN